MPTSMRSLAGCLVIIMLLSVGLTHADPPAKVALTNGTIIPIAGPTIENGTVLIERGKIVAAGTDVEVPYDARVFDVKGKVVFPGMINVHTWRGMDIPNEARPVTPHLSAYDAIDPSQLFFEECLRLGATAVHVIPANNTVIGGQGRVVRPIGMTVADMTIDEGDFLKISITPRQGYDRMVQMAELREAFRELQNYLEKLAEKRYEEQLDEDDQQIEIGPQEARKRGVKLIRDEDIDDQHRNLLRLVGGRVRILDEEGPQLFAPLGAFIYCEAATDIATAVKLAEDHNFRDRAVLVLGGECYKATIELEKAALPVILPPNLTYRERDLLTGEVTDTFVPKRIYDAGLKFALIPGPDTSLPRRMLNYQAAQCVRRGIGRDAALRAITLTPAEMLGLDQRLGSIEPGKDAHLVVFSRDPLNFRSVVEKVFIDGILAYEREKDVRLKRLLAPGTEKIEEQGE